MGSAVIDRVAWLAAFVAWLTVIPIVRLGARWFGTPVGAAAALLFTMSPILIVAVHHYLSVVLGALLLALTLDLLARPAPRAGLAGLTAGFAYLARPEMLLAVPVWAWLVLRGPDQGRADRLGRWAIGFLTIAGVWWVHQALLARLPGFNLAMYLLVCFSPLHPGDGLIRDFAATPDRFSTILAQALPTLPQKWLYFFPRAVKHVLTAPTAATGWLALVGLIAAWRRRDARPLAVTGLLLGMIPVAMMTLLVSLRLYPVPYLPLLALATALGAQQIVRVLPLWAHRPRTWMALLAMTALPSVVMELREQVRETRLIVRWVQIDRTGLASTPRSRQFMFSDTPSFVAWQTGRPTIWVTRDEFERLIRSQRWPSALSLRPHPEDTWFHTGDPRNPADQAGYRLPVAVGP
jgi:hypothetical protein